MAEFFWMGGHGPWVWSAYAVGAAVLSLLVLGALESRRRALRLARSHAQSLAGE